MKQLRLSTGRQLKVKNDFGAGISGNGSVVLFNARNGSEQALIVNEEDGSVTDIPLG